MKAKRVFYILEQIDVDGDNIADGFLASQYRIDKYGNKIFLKNKYITFADLKSRVKSNGGSKSKSKAKPKLQPNSNDVIIMTKDEYNRFMNQNAYNQQYPNQPYPNQQYPNQPYPNQPYPNQPYPNQQYPPNVLVNNGNNNNNSFMSNLGANFAYGAGAGVGLAAGDAIFDGIASFF
jgi:hypothetical protein